MNPECNTSCDKRLSVLEPETSAEGSTIVGGTMEVGDDGVSVGLEGLTGDRPPPRLNGKAERTD